MAITKLGLVKATLLGALCALGLGASPAVDAHSSFSIGIGFGPPYYYGGYYAPAYYGPAYYDPYFYPRYRYPYYYGGPALVYYGGYYPYRHHGHKNYYWHNGHGHYHHPGYRDRRYW